MPDTLLIAIIGALSAVIVALITVGLPMLNAARRHARSAGVDAAAAREQVENNHKTNLRDEADQRHTANTSRLGRLERRTSGIEKSLGRIEDHLGIEHTIPRPPRRSTP